MLFRSELERYCRETGLHNFFFKGWVDKKYIPSILSQGDLNYFHFEQNELKKYGGSLNKMFEYFASGKPTLSDCEMGYDLIQRYQCGLDKDEAQPKDLAELIRRAATLPAADYEEMCRNAQRAAADYDYAKLTGDLADLVDHVVTEYKERHK